MSAALFDLLGKGMLRSLGQRLVKAEEPVFTSRQSQTRLISLLIGLLCTFSPVSSVSLTAAELGDRTFHADTISTSITSPGQIERPSWRTTPPQKAYDLLKQLEGRGGTPPPGYVGGRDFQNRERRLPRGYYREYDVNPKIRGRRRDAERIVIEQRTGKAYYTGDHYRTFVPLN